MNLSIQPVVLYVLCSLFCLSCSFFEKDKSSNYHQVINLTDPYETPVIRNNPNVIGWPEGATPQAPKGFVVAKFADSLDHPRWIYQGPNEDIFVAEAKTGGGGANRITLFRDSNNDGNPDMRQTFVEDLNQPLGMLILNGKFYVANTDAVITFPYKIGQTVITVEGQKIMDLPAGGYNNHWTRNIIINDDSSKILVSVGSGGDHGENGMKSEIRRACILEINLDGSGEQIFASGIRNPVGMAIEPVTKALWTAVNERDNLGDELVPDYITSVKRNAFYGWPYAYFGKNEDPRRKGERPDLVAKSIAPDYALGAHTANLGLAFYNKLLFPEKYYGGAFIGQHGSWNNSNLVGYRVIYVPFENGKPHGPPEDFLTGFIADAEESEVYGRPVSVLILSDGSMLISDDAGNCIWRVTRI